MKSRKKAKVECEYLDQIQRHNLDFDLIPQCAICLSKSQVFCCLSCGKYLEGTGSTSHAYLHALEKQHNLYIHTENQEVICLPDLTLVNEDLTDIKYNLKPVYTDEIISESGQRTQTSRSIDGQSYVVGLIALNSLKSSASTYANCIVFLLASIKEIKELLLMNNYEGITQELGQVVKKMWNAKSFKNHICPHEFFHALSLVSSGKFTGYSKNDPQLFLAWILNQLKKEGFLRKVIKKNVEGKLRVKGKVSKFMYLKLELPINSPFTNNENTTVVELSQLIENYLEKQQIELLRLPTYFFILFTKFQHNGFFIEKSKVVINHDLDFTWDDAVYKLISSVSLQGDGPEKNFHANVFHIDKFYEIQELAVNPIVSQSVTQKEPYILLYKNIKAT